MSEIKRESPLVGRNEALHGGNFGVEAGVVLRERPFLGHASLRGRRDDPGFTAACQAVFGVAPPTAPNTHVEAKDALICWMGPTQWLVLTDGETGLHKLDELGAALDGIHSGVIDLSGGQTLVEIRGKRAVDTLAKGTTLDLHPRSLGAGQCTRTLLASATVFIRVVEPGHAFHLVVGRSFADHLWRWLSDSAEEYGCVFAPPASSLPVTRTAEARASRRQPSRRPTIAAGAGS